VVPPTLPFFGTPLSTQFINESKFEWVEEEVHDAIWEEKGIEVVKDQAWMDWGWRQRYDWPDTGGPRILKGPRGAK